MNISILCVNTERSIDGLEGANLVGKCMWDQNTINRSIMININLAGIPLTRSIMIYINIKSGNTDKVQKT